MNQYTVKEYALMVGKSERAIRKNIALGKYQVKEVPHPSRSDQVSYLILTAEPECGTTTAEPECGTTTAEPECGTTIAELCEPCEPCEPPVGATGGSPAHSPLSPRGRGAGGEGASTTNPLPMLPNGTGGDGQSHLPIPAKTRVVSTLPVTTHRQIPESSLRLAAQKALLLDDVLHAQKASQISAKEAISQVLELYHNGLIHQSLYRLKGSLSIRTVYSWLQAYSSRDHASLAPSYSRVRGHLVPMDDLSFLTGYMMSSAKRKVMSGIKLLHYWNRREGRQMMCSDRTLVRAFEAWKTTHLAIYSLNRYGEKYVREHILPMEELDWSLVRPGELWMSDGHKLNFPVWNPYARRAERPTLVTWFDAAARFPVGFDIDFTENKRVIMSSYRNAVMNTRYCPRFVKMDNGKGFRSQEFSKKLSKAQREQMSEEEEIIQKMISGAIYRTGVERVSFGIPYNSTSKAILERWHRTLDDGLERIMPEYMGNSIADKPARMSRNEKFIKIIDTRGYLTMLEAKVLIEEWILEVYGTEPHPGIADRCPLDVYTESLPSIPAEQRKSAAEFYWLMLSTEIKKLDHNGVKVRGIGYWTEEMVDYVGQSVTVRYDQMDDRYVYIFRADGYLICRAGIKPLADPLATMRPGSELEAMELTHRMKRTRSLLKKIKKDTQDMKQLTMSDDTILQGMIENAGALQLTRKHDSIPEPPVGADCVRPNQNTTPVGADLCVCPSADLCVCPPEDDPDAEVNELYKQLGLTI